MQLRQHYRAALIKYLTLNPYMVGETMANQTQHIEILHQEVMLQQDGK